MILRIYQLNIENPESRWLAFRDWDKVKDQFNFNAYEMIYEQNDFVHLNPLTNEPFEESITKLLDHIFMLFNIGKRPENYNGHSLSVSDIIELDGNHYYVDDFGFQKLNISQSQKK